MAPPKGSSGAEGQEGAGEGVTYTHTEKAEVRSVSVDIDNEERYVFLLRPFPFLTLLIASFSRPAGSVPGFRPTRKVREGEPTTTRNGGP